MRDLERPFETLLSGYGLIEGPRVDDLITDAAGCLRVGTQRYNPFDRDAMPVSGEAYRVTAERCGEMLYGDVGLTNGISVRCFLCSRMP